MNPEEKNDWKQMACFFYGLLCALNDEFGEWTGRPPGNMDPREADLPFCFGEIAVPFDRRGSFERTLFMAREWAARECTGPAGLEFRLAADYQFPCRFPEPEEVVKRWEKKMKGPADTRGAAEAIPPAGGGGRTVRLCPERLRAQEGGVGADAEVWPGNPVFVRDLGDGVKVWVEAEVDTPEPGGAQWRGATPEEVLQGLDAMFPGTVGGESLRLGFDHLAAYEAHDGPMSRGRTFRVFLCPMEGEGRSVWLDFWTEEFIEVGEGAFQVRREGPSSDEEVLQTVVELFVLSLATGKGGANG